MDRFLYVEVVPDGFDESFDAQECVCVPHSLSDDDLENFKCIRDAMADCIYFAAERNRGEKYKGRCRIVKRKNDNWNEPVEVVILQREFSVFLSMMDTK